jgi:hypothetical protein
MSVTRFVDHILGPDTHANRPAASGAGACPWGTVYHCTTHNMLEMNDSGTWIDWASLAGSSGSLLTTKGDLLTHDGSALAALGVGADGDVLTADAAEATGVKWSAGGSGGIWTKYLDNALTAMTGFTGITGTWGAGSGQIAQTGTSAQYNRLKYNTRVARALGAAQVEVRYDSGGTGTTRACGLIVAFDGVAAGSASGGLVVYLISTDSGSTWSVRVESDGWIGLLTIPVSYTPGNYATLAAVFTASGVEFYFNGTYLGTAYNNDTNNTHRTADISYVGLATYAATATFRNLKSWGVTPPF